MRNFGIAIIAGSLALAGCGETETQSEMAEVATAGSPESDGAPVASFGFQEAQSSGPLDIFSGSDAGTDESVERVTSVSLEEPNPEATPIAPEQADQAAPQIAYVYAFGYRITSERIAPLQQHHADLCEQKGPQSCRIISMDNSGSEGDYGYGRLQLAVAADEARDFGKALGAAAKNAEGEEVSSSIQGEDLSKQIVDTEARLRARSLLRDRLMDILRNRNGTVEELVKAERGVAEVNEEIDQARSWLNEMRGRVSFSRVNITYESGARSSGGFISPIRDAFASAGSVLGGVIGGIIWLISALLPIVLVLAGLLWLMRRFKIGYYGRKAAIAKENAAKADEASDAEQETAL